MSSQYDNSTGFTTANTDAASATINWGTKAELQNVVAYTVDKGEDTLGTIDDYTSFCASKSKERISDTQYPEDGRSFSSWNTSNALYVVAKNYFDNTVKPSMPEVTYDNLLILHGYDAYCFAHNAATGSMHAFGGPTGTGYAFCRDGDEASKRFHMYICK